MSLGIIIGLLTLISITVGATVKFTREFSENEADHNAITNVQILQGEVLKDEIFRAREADQNLQRGVHELRVEQSVLREKIDTQSATLEKIERKL
jgi:hypothetical protein